MCLLLSQDEPATARVADSDIKVYKWLQCSRPRANTKYLRYRSPHRDFEYTPNRTLSIGSGLLLTPHRVRYSLPRGTEAFYYYIVNEGFHAFRIRYTADAMCKSPYSGIEWSDIPQWVKTADVIMEMTIPEGAQYYIGTYGDIVSNKLFTGEMIEI